MSLICIRSFTDQEKDFRVCCPVKSSALLELRRKTEDEIRRLNRFTVSTEVYIHQSVEHIPNEKDLFCAVLDPVQLMTTIYRNDSLNGWISKYILPTKYSQISVMKYEEEGSEIEIRAHTAKKVAEINTIVRPDILMNELKKRIQSRRLAIGSE